MENFTNKQVESGNWVFNVMMVAKLLDIGKYAICGSVALKLQGYPILRDIHDVDISCPLEEVLRIQQYLESIDRNHLLLRDSGSYGNEVTQVTIYINGLVVNFLGYTTRPKVINMGDIPLVKPLDIIKYKRAFHRPKDMKDIEVWEKIGLPTI